MLLCGILAAQYDFVNYRPVQSKGTIPDDFTGLFSEKYLEDIKKAGIIVNDKKNKKDEKNNFYITSNYFLSQMFQNGNILFNDPMSEYVSQVLDVVLRDDQKARSDFRVYIIKSDDVNAWATHNGIILVSTAMLAQLSNEAELAFVLSHEIIHYFNHHNIDLYLEEKRIGKNDKGDHNDENDDADIRFGEKNTMYLYYSRELESEADEEGFTKYFSKTNYNLNAVDGLMDVLQYSELPYDEIPFDKSIFESERYKIPASYTLEKLNEIRSRDDFSDTLLTHPNLKKRRVKLHELMKNYSNQNRTYYSISAEKFKEVRNIARFETLRQYLINHEFINALYNANILLKEFPDNYYLETIMASAIYGIAKYRNGNSLRSPFRVEGEIHQLYYLFEKLTKGEIDVLCTRYLWNVHKKYPKNDYISSICFDLTSEFFRHTYYKTEDFLTQIPDSTPSLIDSSKIVYFEQSSKYEKIKSKIRTQEIDNQKSDYTKYAFVDLFYDTSFVNRFYKAAEYYETRSKDSRAKKQAKFVAKYILNISFEEEYLLGLDSVITICPVFFYSNNYKHDEINYFETEKRMLVFLDAVEKMSKMAEVKSNLLSIYSVNKNEYKNYNEYSAVMEWLHETNNTPGDISVIKSESQYLYPICRKYNTRYLDLTGMVSYRRSTDSEYSDLYYNVLLDVETGEPVFKDFKKFGDLRKIDHINSYVYDSFREIKDSKKIKKEKKMYDWE